jgi:hypothetical protein
MLLHQKRKLMSWLTWMTTVITYNEVEGITDLLLQVTKAADTADTTVTHSYY